MRIFPGVAARPGAGRPYERNYSIQSKRRVEVITLSLQLFQASLGKVIRIDSDLTVCGIYWYGRLLGRNNIRRGLLGCGRSIVLVGNMVMQDEPDGGEHLSCDGDLNLQAVLSSDDGLVIAEAAIE